jgi:hypothetical protein
MQVAATPAHLKPHPSAEENATEHFPENRATWPASNVEWCYSFRIRVKKTVTRAREFRDRQSNLLRRLRAWHLVAIRKSLKESDKGIFLLVRQLKVAELSFVEIG